MGEWTNLRMNKQVEIGWANALKTHVTIRIINQEMTLSVETLREKLMNPDMLRDVRKVYKSMLDFAEENK